MISLIKLYEEIKSLPKAIIMGGASGAGKSFVAKNYLGKIKNNKFIPKNTTQEFIYLNPDKYVEDDNMSLGQAMGEFRKEFDEVRENKENIFWDTTGANIKNTLSKLQGYNKFMIMVYTHPMVSILQNAKRDRTLPLHAVVKTWNQVYSNIKEYKDKLKDNFALVQNIPPQFEDEIAKFDAALEGGQDQLKQYLEDLVKGDKDKFKTSFAKDFSFENDETKTSFESILPQTNYQENRDVQHLKNLKKEFQKEFQKEGESPEIEFINKKLKSLQNAQNKKDLRYNEDIEGIVTKLSNPKFKEVILSSNIEDIQGKLNDFLSK